MLPTPPFLLQPLFSEDTYTTICPTPVVRCMLIIDLYRFELQSYIYLLLPQSLPQGLLHTHPAHHNHKVHAKPLPPDTLKKAKHPYMLERVTIAQRVEMYCHMVCVTTTVGCTGSHVEKGWMRHGRNP